MEDTRAEKLIPTDKFVSVAHPNMPQIERKMVVDTSIDHKQVFEIFPEPGDLTRKNQIEFVVHESAGYFVDMSSFQIDVKLKMTDEDGGGRAEFTGYFLNNLTQTLWSSIKVSLNNVNVESSFHNQVVARLNHLLTTPDQLTQDRGQVQGAFTLKSDSDALVISNAHVTKDQTKGRITYSKQNTIHIRGPLQLDIGSAESFLLDGVKIKVTIDPTNPKYLINKVATDAKNYNYEFESVKLIVTKIKPTDSVLLATQKMVLNKPFEYVLRRNIVHTEIIPEGYTEFTVNRPFQELIPHNLYVFFVDQEADAGRYELCPYYWGSYKLAYYSLKINGVQLSGGETDRKLYINEYIQSMVCNNNSEYFIPYKDYVNGKFVLCFDTNNQSDQNSLNIDSKGNMSLFVKFDEELPKALKIYIVGSVDSSLEIDHDRTITTNYQY